MDEAMKATAAAPRLWTPDGFRDDPWVHVADAEAVVGSNAPAILPLALFLAAARDARPASQFGVSLQPGEPIDAILPYLQDLPLVALAFPAFNDGRSFSKAELLRSRHGFTGAVRAMGQVLVDQLPHMLRVGFDEFEVSNPVLLARLESGRRGGIPLYYQPSAAPAAMAGGYSWRRQARN